MPRSCVPCGWEPGDESRRGTVSNLDRHPTETLLDAGRHATEPERLTAREVPLGGPRAMLVRRTLPQRQRSMVGAWCFVDHYGPHDLTGRASASGMRVPPHPHLGLQTVSWLLDGEVLHRDSLGNQQLIQPGQLNLMTAGRGISHSEETPAVHSPGIHGVQLWVALPDTARWGAPAFHHHASLPAVEADGLRAIVIMGSFAGVTSPAHIASPLVGAELRLSSGHGVQLPVDSTFEHAVLAVSGTTTVEGVDAGVGELIYLGPGRSTIHVATETEPEAIVLLLGGVPFSEDLVMWWNFVGRTHDEIAQARSDWMDTDRFGSVRGYSGQPLPAPAMPTTRITPRRRR